jgi:hypothetical protein
MVLIFRVILVLLLSRFRRRIGPLDEASLRFTALPTDCDLNFHMSAGRYLSFMDVGRVELIEREGQLCAIANARGLFRGPNGNVTALELLELAGLPHDTPSPELPEFVQRWRDAESAR